MIKYTFKCEGIILDKQESFLLISKGDTISIHGEDYVCYGSESTEMYKNKLLKSVVLVKKEQKNLNKELHQNAFGKVDSYNIVEDDIYDDMYFVDNGCDDCGNFDIISDCNDYNDCLGEDYELCDSNEHLEDNDYSDDDCLGNQSNSGYYENDKRPDDNYFEDKNPHSSDNCYENNSYPGDNYYSDNDSC